jgi:hypothetical protein
MRGYGHGGAVMEQQSSEILTYVLYGVILVVTFFILKSPKKK